MPNYLTLDFTNAPPGGGNFTDLVPPGTYWLTVYKVSPKDNRSRSGKTMPVVNFRVSRGDQTGKRLIDRFVMPDGPEDVQIGAARLHQLLLAAGFKPPSAKAFRFDLDMLLGKEIQADVSEGELPAQGNRPARKISQIDSYEIPVQRGLPAVSDNEAADDDDSDDEDDEDEEFVNVSTSAPTSNGARRSTRRAAAPVSVEVDDDDEEAFPLDS